MAELGLEHDAGAFDECERCYLPFCDCTCFGHYCTGCGSPCECEAKDEAECRRCDDCNEPVPSPTLPSILIALAAVASIQRARRRRIRKYA